jgi:hypothetical protein
MKKYAYTFFIMIYAVGIYGQESILADSQQHKTNNIGLGMGMVHLITDSDWAPAAHLHYSKCLGRKQRFSVGTGMEILLGDHKHTSVSLALEYVPIAALSIAYGPGLEFPIGNSEDHVVQLTHHIELSYEFDFKCFQLGPMVEYEFSKGDQHLMFGFHTGYGF